MEGIIEMEVHIYGLEIGFRSKRSFGRLGVIKEVRGHVLPAQALGRGRLGEIKEFGGYILEDAGLARGCGGRREFDSPAAFIEAPYRIHVQGAIETEWGRGFQLVEGDVYRRRSELFYGRVPFMDIEVLKRGEAFHVRRGRRFAVEGLEGFVRGNGGRIELFEGTKELFFLAGKQGIAPGKRFCRGKTEIGVIEGDDLRLLDYVLRLCLDPHPVLLEVFLGAGGQRGGIFRCSIGTYCHGNSVTGGRLIEYRQESPTH